MDKRFYGKIAWFDADKGYGVIDGLEHKYKRGYGRYEKSTGGIFVHIKQWETRMEPPRVLDFVSYEVGNFRGKECAVNVKMDKEGYLDEIKRMRLERERLDQERKAKQKDELLNSDYFYYHDLGLRERWGFWKDRFSVLKYIDDKEPLEGTFVELICDVLGEQKEISKPAWDFNIPNVVKVGDSNLKWMDFKPFIKEHMNRLPELTEEQLEFQSKNASYLRSIGVPESAIERWTEQRMLVAFDWTLIRDRGVKIPRNIKRAAKEAIEMPETTTKARVELDIIANGAANGSSIKKIVDEALKNGETQDSIDNSIRFVYPNFGFIEKVPIGDAIHIHLRDNSPEAKRIYHCGRDRNKVYL